MDKQCPSCGGFCKRSGCERENKPMPGLIYYTNNPPVEIRGDMTLRDYFAAKAMQAYIYYAGSSAVPRIVAKNAYAMADAMLEERIKSNG